MTTARKFLTLAFCLVPFALSSCSKPSADDHFRKGNDYFDKARMPDAILEYRAALQIDPKRGDVYTKLADAYMATSDIRGAIGASVRAADALPSDTKAQVRAGSMLLVARAFEDAKSRANKALVIDPKNSDAMILLGNALAGLKNMDGALAQYQDAIALSPGQDVAYANIGTIQVARGQRAEAETNFKKAVEVAPKSVQARMALANFLWQSGRAPEAEQTLKDALALDPTNIPANRALGIFYIASNRLPDAEPYFKAIAKTANSTSASLSLADYYVVAKRPDDARNVLNALAAKDSDYAVATTRLAALDASQGQRAQALAKLSEVIAKHPKEMPARLLTARLLLANGKQDEALSQANSIVKDDPASGSAGEAYVLIGRIQAMSDHLEDAMKAYEEALKRQAQPLLAELALAALHLSAGSLDKAATYTGQALAIDPKNPLSRSMNVRVLLAQGKSDQAKEQLASLQKDYPNSPTVLNLVAASQLAGKQIDAARASYAKAAALSPTDLEATAGLVQIDMATGRSKDALARIDAGLKASAPTGDFLVLAARAYASSGNMPKAEEMLEKAIEVAPSHLAAYGLLGQLYASERRLDEAQKQFEQLVKLNPKSLPAGTMLGMLFEAQKKLPEAEKQYQAVLALDSHAAVAANNLAWIYVASSRNLDQALQLAQAAQQQLPDEPHVNDTLGWIYYRRNVASSAIRYLEASIRKDATDPAVHYHLGMSYALAGEMAKAKKSLQQALSMKQDFDGSTEARKTLAEIGG